MPDAGGGEPPDPNGPDAGTEPESLAPPDTAVGRQLAWLLDVINERDGEVSEAELRQHFESGFLDAVPPVGLQQTFAEIAADGAPLVLLQVSPASTDRELQALVDASGTQLVISMAVEANSGLIQGLVFDEPVDLDTGRPTSWEAVEANVAAPAPRCTAPPATNGSRWARRSSSTCWPSSRGRSRPARSAGIRRSPCATS